MADEEVAGLDRVLTRLALTEDGNLETVIATSALKLDVTAAVVAMPHLQLCSVLSSMPSIAMMLWKDDRCVTSGIGKAPATGY